MQAVEILTIATSRFGSLEASPQSLFTLAAPLAGFPFTRHLLPHRLERQQPFLWLQSLEEPEVAFPAVDPYECFKGWELGLSEDERAHLGLDLGQQPRVYCLCSFATRPSANLAAPLVVNPATLQALQVIDTHGSYRLDEPLFPEPSC